jgi:hypothetical protein
MHVEFVVLGVPISNQSQGSAALLHWRTVVEAEARRLWKKPPLFETLKAVIINFHTGSRPSLDLDNMSKPILDVMQRVIYVDDRQIRQAELIHVRIDAPFVFVGASKLIVAAVQSGIEFVYVRIEEPLEPYPLPS